MGVTQSIGPIAWADGDYTFRLGNGELIMLQDATDCGPYFLLDKLGSKHWKVEEISHIIRLGLIGGKVEPTKALNLVRAYVEALPPMQSVPLAYAILAAGVQGAPDDQPKKRRGRAKGKSSTISQTDGSAGA